MQKMIINSIILPLINTLQTKRRLVAYAVDVATQRGVTLT